MRPCRNRFIHFHAEVILFPVLTSNLYFLFWLVCSCLLKWSVINKFSGNICKLLSTQTFGNFFRLGLVNCSWQWWYWASALCGNIVWQQFLYLVLPSNLRVGNPLFTFCVHIDSCFIPLHTWSLPSDLCKIEWATAFLLRLVVHTLCLAQLYCWQGNSTTVCVHLYS